MRILILFFSLSLGILSPIHAQDLTQTIRGTVNDKQTQSPLPGALVQILDTDPAIAIGTDENGKFKFNQVSIGRKSIRISYLGYKEKIINIILSSGKETVLTVELEESVIQGEEVVITAETDKTKTNNKIASVSARAFTIDEASRYAGSRNDPARMAANFAGVSGANDSRNDIIIRGNSPLGVLWRLNGLDIPNPNHFGSTGSTGGPISILNNNTLDNSDFMSSAFPAGYGNATAGIFDLKMRSGNNEKMEYLAQMGFNGVELGIEGPFSKKKNASFLLNYRYSNLIIFQKLGVNFGTGNAVPQYQDIVFKADIPTEKWGKFSFYGLGGLSYIALKDSDKDKKENLYGYSGKDTYFKANIGIAGMYYTYIIDPSSYFRFNAGLSSQYNHVIADSIDPNTQPFQAFPYYRQVSSTTKYTANMAYHKKFNTRNHLIVSVYDELYDILFIDSSKARSPKFYTLRDFNGLTSLYQTAVNWQHKRSDRLTFNTGIHGQLFALNNSFSVEPRLGMRYSISEKQSISAGLGMHSQLSPMYVYFSSATLPDGNRVETNRNLDFTRSAHAVIGYDVNLGKYTRIKSEIYYQHLYQVPVMIRPNYFSALNLGADFNSPNVDSLVNNGEGKNYGIEFTLEKFYHKGYYYLFTGSLFESKYKGSDGIERNTAFNGNYVVNLLAGKEWKWKEKHILSLDIKLTAAGGKHYVEVDLEKSKYYNREILIASTAFEKKHPDYFRMDIKPSYKLNLSKSTLEWSIDIQNVTRHDNVFQQIYDIPAKELKTEYQLKFFFIPQFRMTF